MLQHKKSLAYLLLVEGVPMVLPCVKFTKVGRPVVFKYSFPAYTMPPHVMAHQQIPYQKPDQPCVSPVLMDNLRDHLPDHAKLRVRLRLC